MLLCGGCVFISDDDLKSRLADSTPGDSTPGDSTGQETGPGETGPGETGLPDADEDGHADRAAGGDDCDDDDPSVHPGAEEQPGDERDQDCDGGETCYADGDDDGVRPDSVETTASADEDCADMGEAIGADPVGDCDDADASVYPGAMEIWYDGTDQDCDEADDYDQDGDGYPALDPVSEGYDCDDTRADVNPGVDPSEERCDLLDQDCDGADVNPLLAVSGTGDWYALNTTVQGAIDSADTGDELCLAPGTYTENVLVDQDITLVGAGGSSLTILDGASAGRVLALEGVTATLEGLTIQNGYHESLASGLYVNGGAATLSDLVITGNVSGNEGGGLSAASAEVSAERLVVRDNTADYGGAGLYLSYSTLNAEDLVVEDNTALHTGGGLLAFASTVSLSDASFLDNTAYVYGGAIYVSGSMTLERIRVWRTTSQQAIEVGGTLAARHLDVRDSSGLAISLASSASALTGENVLLAGNLGGGIDHQLGTLSLTSATLVGNRVRGALYLRAAEAATLTDITVAANEGSAIGGAIAVEGAEPTLTYSHAEGNEPADYEGMDDPTGEDGNISGDPQFAQGSLDDYSAGLWGDDPTAWDLTLTDASPLQLRGDPTLAGVTDCGDDLTLDSVICDIGAYGGLDGDGWPETWPE